MRTCRTLLHLGLYLREPTGAFDERTGQDPSGCYVENRQQEASGHNSDGQDGGCWQSWVLVGEKVDTPTLPVAWVVAERREDAT